MSDARSIFAEVLDFSNRKDAACKKEPGKPKAGAIPIHYMVGAAGEPDVAYTVIDACGAGKSDGVSRITVIKGLKVKSPGQDEPGEVDLEPHSRPKTDPEAAEVLESVKALAQRTSTNENATDVEQS